ncbi:kazrin isoform X1 [Galleria mellonella]|uniref:Kazrin isoform X1 n=1 Tax=Galleria mellonella TaxID=7137 RepID=A0ABM3MPL2_GALME|nr:kazrin isoform X1 [Galleria mellonella]XP_052753303.1 kazrin isoform X1 [Galleria mellonella]XP_052753304.1 kazrin isoform X1 [Galleria mellonella]XP_052753305.1 kazrin isoform X1 [Galleria mellonella]XP_052753306.1 kazrin isoform X1 [Galleria mellonella]
MALVRRILGDAQAKLRKMVDEQVSVGTRVEADAEPEPADPLITPASSALERTDLDPRPIPPERRLLIGTLDKRNGSLNGDKDGTINRTTRLSIRNGKDNPFLDDDNKENQANGKLDSPVKWSIQNGSDSGTYAEIGTGGNSNTSERNILDPADSSEEEMPLPDATSPGRSSDGPEPRADITATLDGEAASPGGRSDRSRQEEVLASPGMLTAAQLARRLRLENERLQAELTRVRRLLVAAAERGEAGTALIERAKGEGEQDATPLDPQQLEKELLLAREAVNSLKADKKRLKAEKFDLLTQMKQLYATLEDKEKELRDFIRNYEQMRSRGGASSALGAERAERERERAALLRHARDEAERSLQLAAALSARDTQLRHAREQLFEARRQLQAAGCLSEGESVASLGIGPPMMLGGPSGLIGDRGSCSADSGVRVTGSSDGGATSVCGGNLSDSTAEGAPPTLDAYDTDAASLVSSAHHLYQLSTPRDCSPTLSPHNSASPFTRSIDAGSLSRSVEQLSSPGECEAALVGGLRARGAGKGGRGRGSAWGSISRVFARSRHRTKSGSAVVSGHESEPVYAGTGSTTRAWSPLGSEAALREAASLPLARWRAPAIIAWLELALGMPQYAAAVADNVKSGKIRALNGQVLLELSDADLEVGLGITQPMHRKKLRLAIEERRRPDLVRNPSIGQLTHAWVAAEWLPDLGLSQYAESFLANLVDARMLDTISKKELEKYLGVTRKFHQASIVHGIHLLRIMKYDRQALAVRRHQCENVDADPLVWTNQRFMRWAHNIDLGEFADNLKDSGVHGGLVVLEPSFTGETMATALGIPPSKSIIRRHLVAEFDALVIPARNMFGHQIRMLGRPFSRSVATGLPGIDLSSDSRRHSLRGSITRALGALKPKHDRTSPSSSSESSSVLSLTTQQYQMSYSPPIAVRTLSQLSMTYAPPPTLQEYEPIYTPLSLYSQSSVSTRDSLQRLNEIKENAGITHRYGQKADHAHRVSSPLPAKSVDDSGVKQKRHRRVKSIGDINACTKASV